MVLDSSPVIAVLGEEPGHERLTRKLERADPVVIAAPTMFEAEMVAIGRFGEEGRDLVGGFLAEWKVEVLPFGADHWRVAIEAFARYGKGRHPAALNYGDCMTYAAARLAAMPLLFTGEDFAKTDVAAA